VIFTQSNGGYWVEGRWLSVFGRSLVGGLVLHEHRRLFKKIHNMK